MTPRVSPLDHLAFQSFSHSNDLFSVTHHFVSLSSSWNFIMVKYAKYVVIESTVIEKEENADFIYLFIGILRQGLVVQTFLELAIILSLSLKWWDTGVHHCAQLLGGILNLLLRIDWSFITLVFFGGNSPGLLSVWRNTMFCSMDS